MCREEINSSYISNTKNMFHRISKHREESSKYNVMHRVILTNFEVFGNVS